MSPTGDAFRLERDALVVSDDGGDGPQRRYRITPTAKRSWPPDCGHRPPSTCRRATSW
jgi:hypothetical protein